MSKKIPSNVLGKITDIAQVVKSINTEKTEQVIKNKEKKINFTFNLNQEMISFIRKFVHFKRFEKNEFLYNQSIFLTEGVSILREKNKELPKRPQAFKIPTTKGRRQGYVASEQIQEKFVTSFRILEEDKDFIYDYIYQRLKEELIYLKEHFLFELIQEMRDKYNLKF